MKFIRKAGLNFTPILIIRSHLLGDEGPVCEASSARVSGRSNGRSTLVVTGRTQFLSLCQVCSCTLVLDRLTLAQTESFTCLPRTEQKNKCWRGFFCSSPWIHSILTSHFCTRIQSIQFPQWEIGQSLWVWFGGRTYGKPRPEAQKPPFKEKKCLTDMNEAV